MIQSIPLVLASQSPRRIGLLKQIGLNPQVVPSAIEEEIEQGASPQANAMRLALAKARDVANGLRDGIIIGADTIVVLDGEYFAKPVDSRHAVRMLSMLSGRTHLVVTGFALVHPQSGFSTVDYENTNVTFREIPRDEIESYVASGSPLDKAGAYGIQDDYGAVFVSRIEGCYYNVVGLPLSKVYLKLLEFSSQVTQK